jgi:1A family penicillin-binding protein
MKKSVIRRVIKIALVFLGAATLALGIYVFALAQSLPSFEEITSRRPQQSTKIYDRSGEVLLYEISAGQKRTLVPLEEIPRHLREATIAIEDQNFYTGPAFSIKGILRALWVNLRAGEIRQGGSTITQQLARNAFLTSEQTLSRKLKELLLAIRLARYYSKDKILELYLNEVPYGPTIYGVSAASEAYFGKPVKDINLAEAALLAAITKAPSYYSPWGNHTKELMERQKLVLNTMKSLGKISDAELREALNYKLKIQPQTTGIKAPHFVLAVQDQLVKKYGEDMVRTGGLTVITTLDWKLQQAAEAAVKNGVERNEKLYGGRNAALVAEDPKTGQILAMVGSRDYFAAPLPQGCTPGWNCQFEPYFNVATQGLRQPGSAIKPFIYLTAFKAGFTPETVVFDVPTEFVSNNPNCPPNPDFTKEYDKCFHPQNFDNKFRGPVNFRTALGQSINVPAVKVLYLVGLKNALKTLNDFGITTLTDPSRYGLSLVLGGGEVRLIELVGAYSVLSQNGIKHAQTTILEVKNSKGEILESYADDSDVVVDAKYAGAINDILSDVDVRSGLFGASLGLTTFPGYDVALKTGTTNDYRDAWAIGYTPNLVVGVWAGNNDNSAMHRQGSSILAAVPIWSSFMSEALKNLPPEPFLKTDPLVALKPILAGDYLFEHQVHSILYYINKEDPLGPPLLDPTRDPQFLNWEFGVLNWAKDNLGALTPKLESGLNNSRVLTAPKIKILDPPPGKFIDGDRLWVVAEITGGAPISKIVVDFNKGRVYESQVEYPANYLFSSEIRLGNVLPQNLLEIEAQDQNGLIDRESVIVYK